jgi:hypothetical protein
MKDINDKGLYENKSKPSEYDGEIKSFKQKYVDYSDPASRQDVASSVAANFENTRRHTDYKPVQYSIEPDEKHEAYCRLYETCSYDHWKEVSALAKGLSDDARGFLDPHAYTRKAIGQESKMANAQLMSGIPKNSMLSEFYKERKVIEIRQRGSDMSTAPYAFTPEQDVRIDDYVTSAESAATKGRHNGYEIIDAMYQDAMARPDRSFVFVRTKGDRGLPSMYGVYAINSQPEGCPFCYDADSEAGKVVTMFARKIGTYKPEAELSKWYEKTPEVEAKKPDNNVDKDAMLDRMAERRRTAEMIYGRSPDRRPDDAPDGPDAEPDLEI